METTYPVSKEEQLALFLECFDEAKVIGYEYAFTLAMAKSMFQYRIGILSNRAIEPDMLEATNKELDAKLEKEKS